MLPSKLESPLQNYPLSSTKGRSFSKSANKKRKWTKVTYLGCWWIRHSPIQLPQNSWNSLILYLTIASLVSRFIWNKTMELLLQSLELSKKSSLCTSMMTIWAFVVLGLFHRRKTIQLRAEALSFLILDLVRLPGNQAKWHWTSLALIETRLRRAWFWRRRLCLTFRKYRKKTQGRRFMWSNSKGKTDRTCLEQDC